MIPHTGNNQLSQYNGNRERVYFIKEILCGNLKINKFVKKKVEINLMTVIQM